MRPKPKEPRAPAQAPALPGVYFLKTQRGYATSPRSPSGQERRDWRRVEGIALVLPEPMPGQLQPE